MQLAEGERMPLTVCESTRASGQVRLPAEVIIRRIFTQARLSDTWSDVVGHPLESAGLPALVLGPTRQGLAKPPGGLGP
jgi:hypothetical protein